MDDKTTHWYDIDGAIGQAAPEDEQYWIDLIVARYAGMDCGNVLETWNDACLDMPVPYKAPSSKEDLLPIPAPCQYGRYFGAGDHSVDAGIKPDRVHRLTGDWHALYTADAPKDLPENIYKVKPYEYKFDPDAWRSTAIYAYRAQLEWLEKHAPKEKKLVKTTFSELAAIRAARHAGETVGGADVYESHFERPYMPPKDLKPAPEGMRTAIDRAADVDATPRMGGKG